MRNLFLSKPVLILTHILYKTYEYFRYRTSIAAHKVSEEKLMNYFHDLTVRSGPFKGMKYPSFNSSGSSLFPKLSGSYESELHHFIERLFMKKYDLVIDIGCAEGYYAVGAALKLKNVEVVAFDMDKEARELCAAMAKINNVASRIKICDECTATWIIENCKGKKNLVICDCEGCERSIFNFESISALYKSDIIIELHPMYNKDIKGYLHSMFCDSHEIYYASSYDDARKIFDLPEDYKKMSNLDKLKLVQEGRTFSMDWLIALSKNQMD